MSPPCRIIASGTAQVPSTSSIPEWMSVRSSSHSFTRTYDTSPVAVQQNGGSHTGLCVSWTVGDSPWVAIVQPPRSMKISAYASGALSAGQSVFGRPTMRLRQTRMRARAGTNCRRRIDATFGDGARGACSLFQQPSSRFSARASTRAAAGVSAVAMGLREDAAAVDDADAAATLLSAAAILLRSRRARRRATRPRERHSPQNVRPTLTSPRRLLPGGEVLSLREKHGRWVRRLAQLARAAPKPTLRLVAPTLRVALHGGPLSTALTLSRLTAAEVQSLDPPVRSMVERFGAQMRTLLRDRTMRGALAAVARMDAAQRAALERSIAAATRGRRVVSRRAASPAASRAASRVASPRAGASPDSGAALEGRIALVREKETDDDASPHSEDTLVDFQQ